MKVQVYPFKLKEACGRVKKPRMPGKHLCLFDCLRVRQRTSLFRPSTPMDFLSLPPLPTVVDPDFYDDHYLENTLPSFLPQFYIPSLEDKPQDPIVTTLLARKKKAEKEPRHLNGILKKSTAAAALVNTGDEISGDDDLFSPDLGPVPQEVRCFNDTLAGLAPECLRVASGILGRPVLRKHLAKASVPCSVDGTAPGSLDSRERAASPRLRVLFWGAKILTILVSDCFRNRSPQTFMSTPRHFETPCKLWSMATHPHFSTGIVKPSNSNLGSTSLASWWTT